MTTAAPVTVEGMFSAIVALTAALTRSADISERVVAGQEAAMAKLGEVKTTRSRANKPTETPAAEQPETAAAEEPAASFLPTMQSADDLKAHLGGWGNAAPSPEDRAARVQFLKDMATSFGTEAKAALLFADATWLQKTLFYIERHKAGLPIDFKADYDFDGDPAQPGSEPAAEEEFG